MDLKKEMMNFADKANEILKSEKAEKIYSKVESVAGKAEEALTSEKAEKIYSKVGAVADKVGEKAIGIAGNVKETIKKL